MKQSPRSILKALPFAGWAFGCARWPLGLAASLSSLHFHFISSIVDNILVLHSAPAACLPVPVLVLRRCRSIGPCIASLDRREQELLSRSQWRPPKRPFHENPPSDSTPGACRGGGRSQCRSRIARHNHIVDISAPLGPHISYDHPAEYQYRT